jgi:D-cysteine desulfhydrase/L-cysteate sulfo-lyase
MFTDKYSKAKLAHLPTVLEPLSNLSKHLKGPKIWIKRDDCTGLAMGGNKARQLEYYLGHALSKKADTILTTGAIQSNHVRMSVAGARKLGMDVEVLLEHRVSNRKSEYYQSGNPFLIELMGAKTHYSNTGDDEDGTDDRLFDLAEKLRQQGKKPYVIPLSENYTPYGSLGYVDCAVELLQQCKKQEIYVDAIVLASGSAATHSGLLCGIRALGFNTPILGACVRRNKSLQAARVLKKSNQVAQMIGFKGIISDKDIWVDDQMLAPGYGQLNQPVLEAIDLLAQTEGILLDPTYTGKAMATLIDFIRTKKFSAEKNILFLHTGGAPALFGYPEILDDNFFQQ